MTTATRRRAQARVGPSGRAALRLLACCPRIPTDVVAALLRMRHARSAAQLLLRLRAAGLARFETARPGPLLGSGAVRLWALTPAGRAILAGRGVDPSASAGRHLLYSCPAGTYDAARRRDMPMLVAVHRLLARVVRDLDGRVRVAAWEHPWTRTWVQAEAGRQRHVRLPAAAVLAREDEPPLAVLLVPDLGTLPVASYRPALRRLLELRQASGAEDQNEPLLIVAVAAGTQARVAAWDALLQEVARQAGEAPLRACIVACPRGLTTGRGTERRCGEQVEEVFGLVARHPLLTPEQLAVLVGTSEARAGRLVAQLAAQGLVRTLEAGDAPPDAFGGHRGQQRPLLVALTPAGRREAARRLLLPVAAAARHHGVLGKDTSTRPFLRHLAHTLGVNAVFVAFVSAARRVRQRGGDAALQEWRSAAACARGRFRPDGYGCSRRGAWRFGFFLEFDRGTERPAQYAAKLAAYYRYRDSGACRRDYETFPTVLLVTTSEVAEARLAHQAWLLDERHAGAPLRAFLTTTARIQAHAEGVLGPVWRAPGAAWVVGRAARVCWLPDVHRARARTSWRSAEACLRPQSAKGHFEQRQW